MQQEQVDRLAYSLMVSPEVFRRKVEKRWIDPFLKELRLDLATYHLMILQILAQSGSQTVNDVGEELAISRSQMTFATDRLVDLGLITRQPVDEDRRKISLDLTLRGRWLLEEFTKYIQKEISLLLNGVQDQVIDQLELGLVILDQFSKNM